MRKAAVVALWTALVLSLLAGCGTGLPFTRETTVVLTPTPAGAVAVPAAPDRAAPVGLPDPAEDAGRNAPDLSARPEEDEPAADTPDAPSEARAYVLNTRSRKFHLPECSSVSSILEENRADFQGTREEVVQLGYEPCGRCKP